MNEHFIKNIEIKNFKCFENFKAEGFGRVNLIGGKNNVGKTAFMEACYLSQAEDSHTLFSTLLEIETHRDIINKLLSKTTREEDIRSLIKDNLNIEIFIKGKGGFTEPKTHEDNYEEWDDGLIKLKVIKNYIHIYTKYTKININPPFYDHETEATIYPEYPDIYKLSDLINEIDINLDSLKKYFSLNFISPYSNSNQELENIIGDSKLRDNKYETMNKYLFEVFNVSSIDIIKNKPMIKSNGEYRELSYFGQGIKTFINIISSILLLKSDFIFIDEIENGIHYTNLDKLWEIILSISKEQNVQVFATTHSKECIESYARVAKKLDDDDITMTTMARNLKNELKALVWDRAQFFSEMEQNHEVRGW